MTALVESDPDWLREINRLFSAQQRQASQLSRPPTCSSTMTA
jgi:hypothetical protein